MTTKLPSQPSILAPPPACGQSLVFRPALEADPRPALRRLRDGFDPAAGVVGIGEPLARGLGRTIPGLRTFPSLSGAACEVPSTQHALWVFLRAADRSALYDLAARTTALVSGGLELADSMETFTYAGGRDLTGYLDGTANPDAAESVNVALVAKGPGLAGSSFAAVQRWVHDLKRFDGHTPAERDAMIGRYRDSNEEIADAPASAHVKRSEQEAYDPPAFMVRRSMPWTTGRQQGLEFIAYGDTLDRFERVLRRMAGLDDGVVDALFRFSRPITGGYYWCPPLAAGRLDLQALGIGR